MIYTSSSTFNLIWRYHLEQMISAGSDEPVAVLIPSAVHDCRFVRMDRRENLGNKRVDIRRPYWSHNARPGLTLGPRV